MVGRVCPARFDDAIRDIGFNQVIKHNGRYITYNAVGEENSSISEQERQVISELKGKYNPDNLSLEDYQAAFSKGELPWQQE